MLRQAFNSPNPSLNHNSLNSQSIARDIAKGINLHHKHKPNHIPKLDTIKGHVSVPRWIHEA